MIRMKIALVAFLLALSVTATQAQAPVAGAHAGEHLAGDPLNLPLATIADLSAPLGQFTVPWNDGAGHNTNYSVHGGLGAGPNGSIYFGGHDWWSLVCRMQPPASGTGMATFVETCGVITNLWSINPGDPNSMKIGGAIFGNGNLTVSAYSYYDGNGTATGSLFRAPNIAGLAANSVTALTLDVGHGYDLCGQKKNLPCFKPAMAGMTMAAIPPNWQALFGGHDAIVTGSAQAVIARTSLGLSVSSFSTAAAPVGTKLAGSWWVGFPYDYPNRGAWESDGAQGYNMNFVNGFVAILNGTRTLAHFHGKGTGWCYGIGVNDPALHGVRNAAGEMQCYDPADGSKGGHGYPLVDAVSLWDMRVVLDTTKKPWEKQPYWDGDLPQLARGRIVGGTYDHATGTLYFNQAGGEKEMVVYTLKVGDVPPPAPDCIGTWTSLTTTVPPACDATLKQTVTETFLFTETLPVVPGCVMPPARDPITTVVDCVYEEPPPPPVEICGDALDNDGDGLVDEDCTIEVTYTCTAISAPGVYANDKDLKLNTTRCDSNGAVTLKKGDKFTITVTVPKP